MSEFRQTSATTETRAFVRYFVKKIMVIPGAASIRNTAPLPDDSLLAGRASKMLTLETSVLSTVHVGPRSLLALLCLRSGVQTKI